MKRRRDVLKDEGKWRKKKKKEEIKQIMEGREREKDAVKGKKKEV